MHDGMVELQIIRSRLPFQFMEDMYIERFKIKGVYDINPALQDYLFEDETDDVSIIADGSNIWVVASSYIHEMEARFVGATLNRKLIESGIIFNHWIP